nr:ulp1 protease family, C-terminal catalytic domain-containing protein [Tanacetum cinerariifolium]
KNDEQQEEQGSDVFSVKRNSYRKKTCASKKNITLETSEDADKEGNNTNRKKRKLKQAELVENEMFEGDKVVSESNEEPPFRNKKLDVPSFVNVRKLKCDMLVIKGAETVCKNPSVGDKRKKDNVEAKKETTKKKVVATERQVSIQKEIRSMSREEELEQFKSKIVQELNHRDDDNVMVVLDNGNDVPEESVKDNEEINREKNVEKVVDQDVYKPKDVKKESEFGNNELVNDELVSMNTECENDNDSGKKEVEKIMKISSKELPPEDSQPEAQDTQPGMEIVAEIQEENLEPVKNCETLEEADFISIGIENIESLKAGGRNLFDEKSTIQNENEDDMILQDSLLNILFLSTQEVACLEIDTQKKQTATQLAKSKETEAKTVKPAPTKRKKKEPNDKEETAIHASPISFIPPPIDTVSEKRQGKPSNFLVSPFYQRKTFEIDIIDNIDNGIDDIKTRYGGFPCALMDSFIDYLERKKYKKCYDLILAEPKVVEIPWKTTYNSHDCGVFVITHMETYLGKGNFLQELKKEGPGQTVQLNMLRAKYMVKILLMSFNKKKKTLLKQAQAYIKTKPKSSKVLTGNDVKVDEELFKQFNEIIIKTIDV